MNPFLERLNAGDALVADGATGTNLQKLGLTGKFVPEDLVLDQPDILLKLETFFVEAGSDIILTCTFGGTRQRMKESKYVDRCVEVNTRAAELARKAGNLSLQEEGVLLVARGVTSLDELQRVLKQ